MIDKEMTLNKLSNSSGLTAWYFPQEDEGGLSHDLRQRQHNFPLYGQSGKLFQLNWSAK